MDADAPLHELRPTTRFSDRAEEYRRFRPSYPAEAIDAVLEGFGHGAGLVGADIGAGTGISARLLADRGVRVIAVEPNAAMRSAADPHRLVEFRDGTAERTGLEAESVDLVLCAQAFHWFRAEASLAEFRRIIRPQGRVALVWNQRDDRDAFTGAYSDAIRRAATDHADSRPVDLSAWRSGQFVRDARLLVFPHRQALSLDGLLGRALSASYIPRSGPAHDRLLEDLRSAHGRFQDGAGMVYLAYLTEVHLAERA